MTFGYTRMLAHVIISLIFHIVTCLLTIVVNIFLNNILNQATSKLIIHVLNICLCLLGSVTYSKRQATTVKLTKPFHGHSGIIDQTQCRGQYRSRQDNNRHIHISKTNTQAWVKITRNSLLKLSGGFRHEAIPLEEPHFVTSLTKLLRPQMGNQHIERGGREMHKLNVIFTVGNPGIQEETNDRMWGGDRTKTEPMACGIIKQKHIENPKTNT